MKNDIAGIPTDTEILNAGFVAIDGMTCQNSVDGVTYRRSGGSWGSITGVAGGEVGLRDIIASYAVSYDGTTYHIDPLSGGTPYSGTLLLPILKNAITTTITAGGGAIIFKTNTVGNKYLIQPQNGSDWITDPNATNLSYLLGIPSNQNFTPISFLGESLGTFGQIYTGNANITTNPVLAGSAPQLYFDFSLAAPPNTFNSGLYTLFSAVNFGGINYVRPILDGLRFTQSDNQHIFVPVDLSNAGSAEIGSLVVDTQLSNASVVPQPASTKNIGVQFPKPFNTGSITFRNLYVAGYEYGIQMATHVVGQHFYAQACFTAIQLIGGNSDAHGNIIEYANIQQCQNGIYPASNNANNKLSILMLDLERGLTLTGTNAWQNWVGLFAGSNQLYGAIYIVQGPNSLTTYGPTFCKGVQLRPLDFAMGWQITTPSLPVGIGSANKVTNTSVFPVTVFQTGQSGTHIIDMFGTDKLLPAEVASVELEPSESIYYVTTIPSSWLWRGRYE